MEGEGNGKARQGRKEKKVKGKGSEREKEIKLKNGRVGKEMLLVATLYTPGVSRSCNDRIDTQSGYPSVT